MLRFKDDGAIVFEYGNAIRDQAVRAGLERAFDFQGFVPLYIRPNFCVGRGPCRWVALSELAGEALPSLMRKVLARALEDLLPPARLRAAHR